MDYNKPYVNIVPTVSFLKTNPIFFIKSFFDFLSNGFLLLFFFYLTVSYTRRRWSNFLQFRFIFVLSFFA